MLAARLSGCSDARIIGRHLLPSFMSYLIVDTSIVVPGRSCWRRRRSVLPRPGFARTGRELGRDALRGAESSAPSPRRPGC